MEGTDVRDKRSRRSPAAKKQASPSVPDSPEASAQYVRSLIEASLDPFVTISPEGKITDVNEATVKVTGVSRSKLVGTDFSVYFTEPEMARQGYLRAFELRLGHGLPADDPAQEWRSRRRPLQCLSIPQR